MKLKAALLSGTFLAAFPAVAHADPVSIGSAIISGFLSIGAGTLLPTGSAAFIGNLVLGAGAIALQAASFIMAKKPVADPNTLKSTSKGTEGHGRYAFGRVMLEGKIGFGNTAGYNIHRLILHCFGPIDAIEEYFYDGRSVTVEEDGAVSSPPFSRPSGSNLYLRTKLGDGSETAWPQLKTDFPLLWTDDHRARGIGQTLLTFINPGTGNDRFPRLLTGGVKSVRVLARAGKCFDPRTNETKWTRNGVLWCAHWISRLPGWSGAMIDWTDVAARATEADALVPIAGGTAPRCTLSGGWEGPITTDIVLEMLDSAGLEVRETAAGKYSFGWLEDNPATELAMPWSQIDDGISSPYIDHDLSAGPEGAKRPNICTLEYFSPERLYEVAEADLSGVAWAKVTHDINVYGDQERRVRLPFCDNVHQASRIARRMFYEGRAEGGLIKTTMAGLATWGKRIITVDVPDVGANGDPVSLKCRKGPVRTDQSDGTCEIPITVIPAELQIAWNPATMEATPPPVLPAFEYESELDTPDEPAEACQIIYPDASREVRLRFTGVAGGITAEATRRAYSAGTPTAWASMTEYQQPGAFNTWLAYVAIDWAGQDADFRVRFFDANEDGSFWSPTLEERPLAVKNTTPTVPLNVGHDPATPGIEMELLATAPDDLHVAYLRFQASGAGDVDWPVDEVVPCRPGDECSVELPVVTPPVWPANLTINYSVTACTSDGTPSAAVTGSYTVTSPPPGGS